MGPVLGVLSVVLIVAEMMVWWQQPVQVYDVLTPSSANYTPQERGARGGLVNLDRYLINSDWN